MPANPGVHIQREYAAEPDLDRQGQALLALLKHKVKPAVSAAGEGKPETYVRSKRG